MKISKFIKEKRLGLSFLIAFFIFLIASLAIFTREYLISIFFVVLIFLFSQYFDFDYRLFTVIALLLLIICPFLLIAKFNTIAEYFANYVYAFLVLGIVGYFFDNLREKIKSKGSIKTFKKVFLSILVIFLLSSAFIFVRDYRRNSDYTVVIKENLINYVTSAEDKYNKFIVSTKDIYNKIFRKDIYYSGLDVIEVDGGKTLRDIIINIDNPKADNIISKTIDLTGWSIETNSIYNTGIDRIEFFLDGKPGIGKLLGNFSNSYFIGDTETTKLVENLYIQFYNRKPSKNELSFWSMNLEYNILSYYDVTNSIINESKFIDKKSLSNEYFLSRLYAGLLNREWDGTLLDRLKTDLNRKDILYILINSEEFKKHSEIYYKNILLKEDAFRIKRKDIGDKYGKQFYLSGFNFRLDSTKYKNGNHLIFIYAHSPIFGWEYKTIGINIEN